MIYRVVFTPEAEEHLAAVIAFTVEADIVAILGVFYGGRDYEALLQSSD